jgi:hypothetical protein
MSAHDEEAPSRTTEAEPYSGSYASPDGRFAFEIFVGDDGIVYAASRGYEDKQCADGVRELFTEIQSHLGRSYLICIDITGLEEITPEARKVWSDTALSKDSPFVRVGLCGGGFFVRSLMNFYSRIAKMPVRLFKTREETVAWLKEATP